MDHPFYIGMICVTPQTTDREIQFSVSDEAGYLFRLVPTLNGFVLSKLDQALDQPIDPLLLQHISHSIESHYC